MSSPEYENVQYATPANEVEGLYGQLAERKCIEIPKKAIRWVDEYLSCHTNTHIYILVPYEFLVILSFMHT